MLQIQATLTLLPSGAWLKAGQSMQVAWLVAPTAVEYLSGAHDVQGSGPDTILYLPATHATQSPLLPVYPALHRQSAIVVIPVTSVQLFAGQLLHVAG
jgi:hypothetical protein